VGGSRGKGGYRGKEGEMIQTLYAHINKRKKLCNKTVIIAKKKFVALTYENLGKL
jgi:hypothetical protein